MKRIAFFIVGLYCLTACDNMVIDGPDRPEVPDETPRIQLVFPEEERVNVYSTATTYENTIESLWVLSFDAVSGILDTLEYIDVAKIVKNGYATQLLPQLSFTPQDGRKIVCIANSRRPASRLSFDPTNPAQIATVDTTQINNEFLLDQDNWYQGDDVGLPMYGSFIWGVPGGYTCEMIRAVAKVQVRMGTSVSDVTGNFSADNVSYAIYNYGFFGYIKQDPAGVVNGIPRTGTTWGGYPFYFTTLQPYFLIQNDNTPYSYNGDTHVYLFEYPSSNRTGIDINTDIGNKTFHPQRQHIILTKNNSPNPNTYYRLDFYNPKDSTYFDTKRNHHYMFTINKVRSEGYTSIEEAQSNPGSNIEYEVRVNDVSRYEIDVTSNGQYAIVACLDSNILFSPGSPRYIGTARYQLPNEMRTTPPHTFTTNTINVDVATFTASPALPPGTAPITVTPLQLDSLSQPIILNINPAVTDVSDVFVTFRLGNIIYRWPIKFYLAF